MSRFIAKKVVAQLPAAAALTPSTLYFVRAGNGFDLYLTTDASPVIARAINTVAENLFEPWEVRRAYWTDQIHDNATGRWLALNGADVTALLEQGYEELLEHRPDLFQVGDAAYAPMTSDTAPAPQAATCSGYSGSNYHWYAFSSDAGKRWESFKIPTAAAPQWIQIDLGAGMEKVLSEFTIDLSLTGASSTAPKNFSLLGSADNATFTALKQMSGVVWATGETVKTYEILDPFPPFRFFRFFRFAVTATQGNNVATVTRLLLKARSATVLDTTDPRDHSVSYVRALW